VLALELADLSDADGVVALRDAAAHWLVSQGIRQWEPGEVSPAEVTAQITDGQWWVLRGGSGLRAALRLVDEDPHAWGHRDDPALYVHGLVISRQEVGAGLGVNLLRWVEATAAQRGVPVVRLDAVETNERLRAYYRRHGFREVGRATFDDPRWYPAVLLEKMLA
jgi:ribosomal protein S18 acetylase RimI-like enzyme